jgi:acylphosphatase
MSAGRARLKALVYGHVQGVGFRFFVERQAVSLGIVGYTRNLRDGSVEVVAEGPRPALEALLSQLGRGPRSARVDRVVADWSEATGEFDGFSVRP